MALSAALAIVMGAALALLGLLKMGFVSQFLAYSVQVGFMFGLGLTIAVGQLPKVLGIPCPEEGFFPALGYLLANVGQTNPWTAALGLGGLAALLLLSRLAPRAPAAIIVVGAGILITAALGLSARGVATVGNTPACQPRRSPPSSGRTCWTWPRWRSCWPSWATPRAPAWPRTWPPGTATTSTPTAS